MEPLVSIIIPCFNQSGFIGETIGCLNKLQYQNWEAIIVNDGSTDDSEKTILAIIANLPKFRYVKQENKGLAEARNAGIRISNGKYILPLDADDLISPDYISEAVEYLEHNPQTGIVYANAEFFGEKQGLWELPDFSMQQMLTMNCIFCTSLFRKEDFDRTKGYNPAMVYGWEDWDFWLTLIELGRKVHKIDKTHFYYRIRSESMLRTMSVEQRKQLKNLIFKNHLNLYGSFYDSPAIFSEENHKLKTQLKNITCSPEYRYFHKLFNVLRKALGKKTFL